MLGLVITTAGPNHMNLKVIETTFLSFPMYHQSNHNRPLQWSVKPFRYKQCDALQSVNDSLTKYALVDHLLRLCFPFMLFSCF